MMAAENSSPNPLLQRARRAAASLAVVLSLALPGYVAPGAAAAQPPTTPATEQQKNGPAKSDSAVQKIQEKAELFGEILADLQDLYVEPVDLDKLAETGFQAMLSSLDPYTEFENVEAAKVMRTQTIGNYGGVGLVITKNKDTKGNDQPYISVVNSFEGYAFDAGMRVGDTLISVDGKDVKDTSTNDVSLMLKGEPGSKVALKYKRPGLDQVQVLPLSFGTPRDVVGWHASVSGCLHTLTVLTRCAYVWVTLPDVRAYAQDCAATRRSSGNDLGQG
jgi:C-terminal processing protease CtpA/Prc